MSDEVKVEDENLNENNVVEEPANNDNNKKPKKKLSKGAIIGISVGATVGVVLIVVLAIVLNLLFGGKAGPATVITSKGVNITTYDPADPTGQTIRYFVGDKNELSLTAAFPGATEFKGAGASGDKIAAGAVVDGEDLTFKNADGNLVKYKVYKAAGAYNVVGDSTETDMRAHLSDGNSVVLHQDLQTVDEVGFAINKGATLYGNGHKIRSHSISAPKNGNKSNKDEDSSWGSAVFTLKSDEGQPRTAMHLQDLHLICNDVEGEQITLDDFEFSGNGIDIVADPVDGKYEQSTITNVIVENGQKLLHVAGADVKVEGCIFRNSADANIALGTYARLGNHVTIKNCVAANSMVSGLLFYGWENVNESNKQFQQTVDIEGFFDIYNWKKATETKLVPATENYTKATPLPVANIVNGRVKSEIQKEQYGSLRYNYKGEDYVHVGIIRLSTGSCTLQDPVITFNGKAPEKSEATAKKPSINLPQIDQYSTKDFPIPPWVTDLLGIVKICNMTSYQPQADFAEGEVPYILPDSEIPDDIAMQLTFGRA